MRNEPALWTLVVILLVGGALSLRASLGDHDDRNRRNMRRAKGTIALVGGSIALLVLVSGEG